MVLDLTYSEFISHLEKMSPVCYCLSTQGSYTFFTVWDSVVIRYITTNTEEHDFLENNYKVLDLK